jgi:hypothetical protein
VTPTTTAVERAVALVVAGAVGAIVGMKITDTLPEGCAGCSTAPAPVIVGPFEAVGLALLSAGVLLIGYALAQGGSA